MHKYFKSSQHQNLSIIFMGALIGFLLLGVVSCGDDDSPADPGNGNFENSIRNDLVFTRQNGTSLVMGTDYAICCGIWEPGYIDKNTLKIFFYDPLLWTDPDQAESFWKLFIVLDELQLDRPYAFPLNAESPLRLFCIDADSGNELSGDEEESRGTITIDRLHCGPPVRITFSIDAIIGSEFHLEPTVTMTGTFTAVVYSNPSSFGCDFGM